MEEVPPVKEIILEVKTAYATFNEEALALVENRKKVSLQKALLASYPASQLAGYGSWLAGYGS